MPSRDHSSTFGSTALNVCAALMLICGTGRPRADMSSLGFIDVTKSPYSADKTGKNNATQALQSAINAAASSNKACFIPAGDYLISNTLRCGKVVVYGSSVDPNRRSRIILEENSSGYARPADLKPVIEFPIEGNSNVTYDRMLASVDIKVRPGNDGAVGVTMKAAEGTAVYDVLVDMTESGNIGFKDLPGGGGSTHKVTVLGGNIGIHVTYCQPTNVVSNATLIGQKTMATFSITRGPFVLVGSHIKGPAPHFGFRRQGAGFNGSFEMIDCIIESEGTSPVFEIADRSFFTSNCYFRNAPTIYSGPEGQVPGNAGGWIWYSNLTVERSTATPVNGDGIWLDGSLYGFATIYQASQLNKQPPTDLLSRHSWGESFPSGESADMVDIRSYSGRKSGDDWAPAFQAAINEHEVVFVPPGSYPVYNTIKLKANTKLIGMFHTMSRIEGYDIPGKRFGGNTQPLRRQLPIIETVDSPDANTIIAHVGITTKYPYESHSPESHGHYGLKWMAGGKSSVRMVDFCPTTHTYWRETNAMDKVDFGEVSIPHSQGGLTFTSDCDEAFCDRLQPSKLLRVKLSGGNVLMTRWHKPLANMTISGSNFSMSSLDLHNGLYYDFDPQYTVTFTGTKSGGQTVHKTYNFVTDGKENPRDQAVSVQLGWSGLSKVEITSPEPFGVNNIATGSQTISFSGLSGSSYKQLCGYPHLGAQHIPIYLLNEATVVITGNGGGNWYNWWQHGKKPYRPDVPFIRIKNNSNPVRFYHLHMQHSFNEVRMIMDNARNVDIYGIKTEVPTALIRVYDSDNIRIMGHGGMTNPVMPCHQHYYFENTPNFLLSNFAEEVYLDGSCEVLYHCDDPLPKNAVQNYDAMLDVFNGQTYTYDRPHRPILYQRGNPALSDGSAGVVSTWPIASNGTVRTDALAGVKLTSEGTMVVNPDNRTLEVRLVTLQGKTVYARRGKGTIMLPSNLGAGMYLVRVSAAGASKTLSHVRCR